MTIREWKPGDVALVRAQYAEDGAVAVLTGVSSNLGWAFCGKNERGLVKCWSALRGGDAVVIRPLVVIDPEDREQVERLWTRYYEEVAHDGVDALQRALREFADPTTPKCSAALNIKGEHFGCVDPEGHGGGHRNPDAESVWGEPA